MQHLIEAQQKINKLTLTCMQLNTEISTMMSEGVTKERLEYLQQYFDACKDLNFMDDPTVDPTEIITEITRVGLHSKRLTAMLQSFSDTTIRLGKELEEFFG